MNETVDGEVLYDSLGASYGANARTASSQEVPPDSHDRRHPR